MKININDLNIHPDYKYFYELIREVIDAKEFGLLHAVIKTQIHLSSVKPNLEFFVELGLLKKENGLYSFI